MDKQKCIKALLDNLYEVYLQEGTIEKYQSHIQWAFKEAINNMRCFFKNDSFSCENEYRVILLSHLSHFLLQAEKQFSRFHLVHLCVVGES